MIRIILAIYLILLVSCSNNSKDQNKNNKEITSNNKSIFITDSHTKYPDILPYYIVDQLKGKVVYVDIWGTWCRPCREEIPFSKTLQAKYENKNIAFLFLCLYFPN